MIDTERFDRAIARFDAANADDPNRESVAGHERPRGVALRRAPHGDACAVFP
jgi:hypothetical protein